MSYLLQDYSCRCQQSREFQGLLEDANQNSLHKYIDCNMFLLLLTEKLPNVKLFVATLNQCCCQLQPFLKHLNLQVRNFEVHSSRERHNKHPDRKSRHLMMSGMWLCLNYCSILFDRCRLWRQERTENLSLWRISNRPIWSIGHIWNGNMLYLL